MCGDSFDTSPSTGSSRPLEVAGRVEGRDLNELGGPMARLEELLEQGHDLLHGGSIAKVPTATPFYEPAMSGGMDQSSVLQQSHEKLQELFEMASGLGRSRTHDVKRNKPTVGKNSGAAGRNRLLARGNVGNRATPSRGLLNKNARGDVDDREDVSLEDLWKRVRRELEEYRNNKGPFKESAPRRPVWNPRRKALSQPRMPTALYKPKNSFSTRPTNRGRSLWSRAAKPRSTTAPPAPKVSRGNVVRRSVAASRRQDGSGPWERLYALASAHQAKRKMMETEMNARRGGGRSQTSVQQRFGMLRMKSAAPMGYRGVSAASGVGSSYRQVSPPLGRVASRSRGWSAPARPATKRERYNSLATGTAWTSAMRATNTLGVGKSPGNRRHTSSALSGSLTNCGSKGRSVGGLRKTGTGLRDGVGNLRRRATELSLGSSPPEFQGTRSPNCKPGFELLRGRSPRPHPNGTSAQTGSPTPKFVKPINMDRILLGSSPRM